MNTYSYDFGKHNFGRTCAIQLINDDGTVYTVNNIERAENTPQNAATDRGEYPGLPNVGEIK